MRIRIADLVRRSNHHKKPSEVEEELQFHIEMLERKYAQHGLSIGEAKLAAVKRFGNFERIKQQCVDISSRNSRLRRILTTSSSLTALTGLAIQTLSSDYKVARIGVMLIMIAISGRLLLYVRGLSPWTFLPKTKQLSVPVVANTPEDGAQT